MTISSVSHLFTVNSVGYEKEVPARVNVKKRIEQIVYRTLSNRDKINLAYVIGQDVNPDDNLVISDRSTSLVQNRIPQDPTPNQTSSSTLLLNVDKFLVTDVFTEDTPTLEATPLFYTHSLVYYNDDLTDFANRTLLSLEFADENLKPINISEYVLDSATGDVYNNLENVYNASDGSFVCYYIKYTVRVNNSGVYTTSIYHELVNNKPVFTQASFDDIDDYGAIIAGHKKYLIEEAVGGEQFQITLPVSSLYAYKEIPESRLRLLPPTATNTKTPWYVRVSNGKFIQSLKKTATSFLNHKYYLAEFSSQVYNPYPPYKQNIEQSATWLNKNLIHLPKNVVNNITLGLFVEVFIRDSSGVLKYVYSNDESKNGATYGEGISYSAGILSIDEKNGFIELDNEVKDTDEILVTYYTEENEYEFVGIDFNPINNKAILNNRVVFYVIPENTYTGTLDKTLYYLLVNQAGEITFSSQIVENPTGLDPSTQKLQEDFLSDGSPSGLFYYNITSSTSGLNYRASGVNTSYRSEFSFVDKYSVESQLLTTINYPSGVFASANFVENPRVLILGDVFVGEAQSPGSLTTIDIREQGGGIKPENLQDALFEQPEVMWYWDRQHTYPGAHAFMVEIPQTLLTEHGGTFSSQQVRDIIERHMEVGGYPILKTYGIDPVILTAPVTSGTMTITWPSYGSSASYDVMYSRDISTGFTTANGSHLSDTTPTNSYTITGLTPSTKYYVKVGAYDSDSDLSFGPTISATTSGIIP